MPGIRASDAGQLGSARCGRSRHHAGRPRQPVPRQFLTGNSTPQACTMPRAHVHACGDGAGSGHRLARRRGALRTRRPAGADHGPARRRSRRRIERQQPRMPELALRANSPFRYERLRQAFVRKIIQLARRRDAWNRGDTDMAPAPPRLADLPARPAGTPGNRTPSPPHGRSPSQPGPRPDRRVFVQPRPGRVRLARDNGEHWTRSAGPTVRSCC